MKYKLIQEYPGSPKLGTIVIKSTQEAYYAETKKFTKEEIENYLEYWELQWKDLNLEEWLEETKKLNLSKEDLEYKLNYGMSSYLYNKLNGKYTEDKAEILYNKWNPKLCLDYKVLLWSYGQNHEFKTVFPNGKCKAYGMYTVRRLSDGEEFSVGDNTNVGILRAFEIRNEDSKVNVFFEPKEGSMPNYYVKLEDLKKAKEVLFTTKDGIDIYKGDIIYFICMYPKILGSISEVLASKHHKTLLENSDNSYVVFKSKEKAKEFITFNTSCLSLNDILQNIKENQNMVYIDSLEQLVKSKLK